MQPLLSYLREPLFAVWACILDLSPLSNARFTEVVLAINHCFVLGKLIRANVTCQLYWILLLN